MRPRPCSSHPLTWHPRCWSTHHSLSRLHLGLHCLSCEASAASPGVSNCKGRRGGLFLAEAHGSPWALWAFTEGRLPLHQVQLRVLSRLQARTIAKTAAAPPPPNRGSNELLMKHKGTCPSSQQLATGSPSVAEDRCHVSPAQHLRGRNPAGDRWALEHCQQQTRKNLLPKPERASPELTWLFSESENIC